MHSTLTKVGAPLLESGCFEGRVKIKDDSHFLQSAAQSMLARSGCHLGSLMAGAGLWSRVGIDASSRQGG